MVDIGPPSVTDDARTLNKRRQPLILIAALLMLAAPACASMQQRVTESENRSSTIEAQVADLQATQQNIIARLTQLRDDLEMALDPVRAQQASGGADLQALQAQVDSLQQQIRLLTDQLAALEAAGVAPPTTQARPTTPMPPPTEGGQAGAAADTGGAPAGGEPASDQESLFNAAYGDYTSGQFVLAVSGFEEFLSRYPEAPRAADALYWIGESMAAQDRHDDARRRFLDVPQRFPSSPKVPDAILRAALEAVELGQVNDAIRELRQLIAAYGSSDAALIGCMQLDRMGQALPAGCG